MPDQVILIGVNEYDFMPRYSLKYAVHDMEALYHFFRQRIGLSSEDIWLMTNPQSMLMDEREPLSTAPSSSQNGPVARRLIRQYMPGRAHIHNQLDRLQEWFRQPEDRIWLFFSGHGLAHKGHYYLFPQDGNPNDIEGTCLNVDDVLAKLRRCKDPNGQEPDILIFLDACRSEAPDGGRAILQEERAIARTGEQAQSLGQSIFWSCAPGQKSYECDQVQHGIFTQALLDAWYSEPMQNTIEKLSAFLRKHVPDLCTTYDKPRQDPIVSANLHPVTQSFPLFDRFLQQDDLEKLQLRAFQLEKDEQRIEEAAKTWARIYTLFNDPAARENAIRLNQHLLEKSQDPKFVPLRNLLNAQEWRKADLETWRLMCLISGKSFPEQPLASFSRGITLTNTALTIEDIARFPYEDLRIIDDYWLKASGHRFGFSVQKRIYESVQGDYHSFGDAIGWRANDSWLFYSDVQFKLDAPMGHLPVGGPRGLVVLPWEEELENPQTKKRLWKAFSSFVLGEWRYLRNLPNREKLPQKAYDRATFNQEDYSYELLGAIENTIRTAFKTDLGIFIDAAVLDIVTASQTGGHRLSLSWVLGRIALLDRLGPSTSNKSP